MDVRITNDHIFVKTPYDHRDYVKDVLNGVYSKAHKMNRWPRNINAMRELMKVYPILQVNPAFVSAGKKLRSAQDKLLEIKSKTDTTGPSQLRPYQRVDIEYLSKVPHAGIFNEQRTGKTPTTILLLKRLRAKVNIIIAPASLIYNWAAEFEKWYPEMQGIVYNGTPKEREQMRADFEAMAEPKTLIVSKDTWKRECSHFAHYEFDCCIVDEAHYLRNFRPGTKVNSDGDRVPKGSQQAVAVMQAGKQSKHRYALTGTPSVKHAADIFGILHFLYPEKFNSYWQFVERYFVIQENHMGHMEVGGVKTHRQKELEELIGFLSVQRKRKDVMAWLPDKERITLRVEMTRKQWKLYDDMVEDFLSVDDEGNEVETVNVLSQLMRMRQLCLDPRLIGLKERGAKTDALLEWLDDNREPVVIMSMFTSYLHMIKPEIEALGLKVGMIHGEMSNGNKHRTASEFQAGRYDVLLCNIISAGTGFTLDRAEVVIFTDKAWNPTENEQAEDRITPTVEERVHKHSIVSVIAQGSYDESINRLLEDKKSITDIINEGGLKAIVRLLQM